MPPKRCSSWCSPPAKESSPGRCLPLQDKHMFNRYTNITETTQEVGRLKVYKRRRVHEEKGNLIQNQDKDAKLLSSFFDRQLNSVLCNACFSLFGMKME